MSVAATAIPPLPNLLDNEQELYQFLLACQEKLRGNQGKIFNFSQSIPFTDPLRVLAAIQPQDCIHFYGENRQREEAVLGYGVTCSLELSEGLRFHQSQTFLQACFQKIVTIPGKNGLTISPQIFCGFTFFETSHPQSSFPTALLFLPQLQFSKRRNQCFLSCNIALDRTINIRFLIKQIYHQLHWLKHPPEDLCFGETSPLINPFPQPIPVNSTVNVQTSIQTILKSIQNQDFSKVVLAQAMDVWGRQNFQIAQCLHRLRNNYRDCYLFSIGNGRGSCFIGASPERLLSIHNDQLVTDALAGSAPRGQTPQEDAQLAYQLLQSNKERREHQAVIEFILKRLTELGLTPQRSPLKLLKLSNIQHLWTPIHAQLRPSLHPLDILAKLHPTPAVAGVPTQTACQIIQAHENFDRSLYAAPLGWVDAQGNSEFIVGIRSALIYQNQARLYAGAGIVAGSVASKELAEINLKLQTLLKALV
jgi:menaquinone-specific isochorismate synthase